MEPGGCLFGITTLFQKALLHLQNYNLIGRNYDLIVQSQYYLDGITTLLSQSPPNWTGPPPYFRN